MIWHSLCSPHAARNITKRSPRECILSARQRFFASSFRAMLRTDDRPCEKTVANMLPWASRASCSSVFTYFRREDENKLRRSVRRQCLPTQLQVKRRSAETNWRKSALFAGTYLLQLQIHADALLQLAKIKNENEKRKPKRMKPTASLCCRFEIVIKY